MSIATQQNQGSGIEEILAVKATAGALTETEWQIVRQRMGEIAKAQIKDELDVFARTIAGPQLARMKIIKRIEGIGPGLRSAGSEQTRPPSSSTLMAGNKPILGRTPQARSNPPNWPAIVGGVESIPLRFPWPRPWWTTLMPPYPPRFTSLGPSPEFDVPTNPSWDSLSPNSAMKIELATLDGSISLGAALGFDVGAQQGPDMWLFGDATIAHGSITEFVTVPAYDNAISGTVAAHISIGNGQLPLEFIEASEGEWAGLLGYVNLNIALGGTTSTRFLFDWKGGNGTAGNYWLPDFWIQKDFSLQPGIPLLFGVDAWVSALRVGSGTAAIGLLDRTAVKGWIPLGWGNSNIGTGVGPIRLTEIDISIL